MRGDALHMLIAGLRHGASRNHLGQIISCRHHGGWNALSRLPTLQVRRLLQTQVPPAQEVPFRKQLNDEIKERKQNARRNKVVDDGPLEKWELTVGLEIHAQLNTEHKLFSGEYQELPTATSLLTLRRSFDICQRPAQHSSLYFRFLSAREPACMVEVLHWYAPR